MRLSRADFSLFVQEFFGNIEFASQDLTAFGGLELARRYLALIVLIRRVRTCFCALRSRRRLSSHRHDLGDRGVDFSGRTPARAL